jgi:hypothetical protein
LNDARLGYGWESIDFCRCWDVSRMNIIAHIRY